MEGDAKIPIPGQVERKHLRIEVDYSNFIEVNYNLVEGCFVKFFVD